MGILANSVSICQFVVAGDLPAGNELFSWASGHLSKNAFRSIDEGIAEVSLGWVHTGNHQESTLGPRRTSGTTTTWRSACARTGAASPPHF